MTFLMMFMVKERLAMMKLSLMTIHDEVDLTLTWFWWRLHCGVWGASWRGFLFFAHFQKPFSYQIYQLLAS